MGAEFLAAGKRQRRREERVSGVWKFLCKIRHPQTKCMFATRNQKQADDLAVPGFRSQLSPPEENPHSSQPRWGQHCRDPDCVRVFRSNYFSVQSEHK